MSDQIKITFPDGASREFLRGVSGFEIAKSIAISLAKSALAIRVNGELHDLSYLFEADAKIEIITPKSGVHTLKDALEIIRHDAAHIMAEAVKELFPETQVTIGPAIENGFYYDFARKEPFVLEDLEKIENKMREITKRDEKLVREVWKRDEAVKFFNSIGEKYKAEIIASIPANEDISLYRQGQFIDLCRGPHAPSTSHVKHFKLMKLAGAYWRGDSKNEMLQRIYGTAWESEESLKNYLHVLVEAEKRDHRKIGRALDLFHIQEEATGSVFWHPKGWIIYREIEKYLRQKLEKNGYVEVKTPQLVDRILWEKSGHWEKFRENMFVAESEERLLAIKPMNCPCHVQIFNQDLKSYRQLPLRMAEFGSCHRNESSGSLHGIMRVRAFTQDDAHIFCEEHQINSETISFCELLKEVYRDFGFEKIDVKFSTRPEKRAGSDDTWDKAEAALAEAVKKAGLTYEINPGEGAFYGPKLEFHLTDAIGRTWQCGTLQVDFILPERLDASYVAQDGSRKRPVMLHRAIIGTFERFIGILIENCAGKFPLWLAPVQMVVATITNDSDQYARQVLEKLKSHGFRAEADLDSQKISYKIREHSLKKIPYILAVGKKESESGSISVRKFGEENQYSMSLEEFILLVRKRLDDKK
ncbi:MAG: threonine--tRNA ligase [Alphaproteobacteria bacterium RIFCSPLOWO2_01_FULL_40_26]|nr:MAG: threonine--tRNA ligase [Alphaproteobacteria bacterium RIFCSPHIGHO2_02_FULL_40_34]OFW87217.1 MAG: threonine--tRNA ligase [Alphaproteobacteria bacterium RIFCSPHIGHO2_01_FULL_40_8]OFW95399.1 MAG: threonine--tRNA ligase [Alphaproteobacteria bacterium RIFCSPLOWO2_01_FULL_40_26]OFX10038.1 MAG: threonine--tRNA ligase [Alphaproteobacteria bacterium RIFCSPLOWO2_02_FULL_40_19]OFX11672.1 MAG: threonine--tRNA ligase [Alphaproteobacteria bacterium RIFCSPLOWO2_12_FULL_40_11]